ncbi:MAG: hypothetical protein ACSW8G_03795 [Bacillota bacterium]
MNYSEWMFSSCDSDVKHKVSDIRLYSDDKEKIEIELKPVYINPLGNGVLSWEDWNHYDSIRIYKTDYEKLILPAISSLFPVKDPDPHGFGVQESFDLTSVNFFGKDDWQRLIDNLIECMKKADKTEYEFYYAVLGFLNDCMSISDWFCIEGNL